LARPKRYEQMVAASRDEASLAVRLFNDPAEVRAFEGFVVHMHLAWLYLLHAEFERDSRDFRYWKKVGNARRLERIDGEPKRWELAECVKQRWSTAKDPVPANLSFFIGLRNKIEHRYSRQQQALATAVSGEAQALILNYETELTTQFGLKYSLATTLRFPIFIGSFTNEGEKALRSLRRSLPAVLRTYIADYHAHLDPETINDSRYEMRLRVFPEVANRPSKDVLPLQFVSFSQMTPEEKEALEQSGTGAVVLLKERQRDVIGEGHYRPKEVVALVQAGIPFKFGMGHFVKAWQKLEVRPQSKSPSPSATQSQYCTYDRRHGDYGYLSAFVDLLIARCSTEQGFRNFSVWLRRTRRLAHGLVHLLPRSQVRMRIFQKLQHYRARDSRG
jgi:Protein of unknown function (DUF3644)